ncbi:MAG: hypothetical protein JWN40_3830 [Phycisphaerales bacterium]|nr:hypothetical protein [Phycisphaerales bacterium]
MSAAVLHLRSLGQLTADTQRAYAALARTVERLAIVPAMTIDGVPYFDAQAVERITTAVAATSPPVPPTSHRAASCAAKPANVLTPRPYAPRGQRQSRGEKPHDRLSPSLEGATPR